MKINSEPRFQAFLDALLYRSMRGHSPERLQPADAKLLKRIARLEQRAIRDGVSRTSAHRLSQAATQSVLLRKLPSK